MTLFRYRGGSNDDAPTGAGVCRVEAGPSVQRSLRRSRLGRPLGPLPPRAADDAEAGKAQAQQQSRARLGYHGKDGE